MSDNSVKLQDVLTPVSGHLRRFEEEYKRSLESDSSIIRQITEHLYGGAGKRLRPALIFMTCGDLSDASIHSALAVEFIHTATLLHDDVVDESRTRRGIETVNHKWNNLVSVLMGDYFFAKAFNMLVKAESPEIMGSFARATERVSIGELNQVFYTGDFDITEERYLDIIADKTASLFACACEAGAICDGDDDQKKKALRDFGEYLGIAFQITDDLLDLIGESAKTGKQLGSDIREGWVTLPLIHALKNGGNSSKDRIVKLYNEGFTEERFENVVNFVREAGGIEYADREAQRYSELAKESVANIKGLVYKDNLLKLADIAVTRDK